MGKGFSNNGDDNDDYICIQAYVFVYEMRFQMFHNISRQKYSTIVTLTKLLQVPELISVKNCDI